MATIRQLRGRWQAQVRRRGVPPRAKSFDRRSDAERWAREIESEADRSGWVSDTRLAEKTTLGELLTRYCAEVTPTKKSASSEKARIGALIRRDVSHRTLAKLNSTHIASYRDERLKTVAPATVIRELNTISHALEIAQREWGFYLPRNPVKSVRRPTAPRGRQRRLHEGEEERILAACDQGRNRWLKPLIVLAIETGMRRGELVGLLWEHIDLRKRVAHLPETKNGESRDVPLSQRASSTLQALYAERGDRKRVFPLSGNAVRLAWEHLRQRAGCPDLHFHDLRHEAVSRLFERGLNIAEVSTISGHKELRMLQRYTHLRAADLVQRLG
jgi:integrase